jgi:dTDP-glucose 4,6-dehydratase
VQFVPDRPGHDRHYAIDAAKIRAETGWAPAVGFDAGLKETVRWYVNNQNWIASVTSGQYRQYYESVYLRQWQTTPTSA